MRRAALVAGAVVALSMVPARAEVHDVSVGNYWYENDDTGSRDALEVARGDQIRFTIRETDYPPHSINVDELNLHSGDLLLFDTYTTPPLRDPGTYTLYCTAHRDRGHVTKVIVRAPPPARASPKPTKQGGGVTPSTRATPTTDPATNDPRGRARPFAQGDTASRPTEKRSGGGLAPVGIGTATDRRPAGPDELEQLTGHTWGGGAWTRAVLQALLAGLPIAGATAFAIGADRRRARARRRVGGTSEDRVVVIDLTTSELAIGRASRTRGD